MKLTNLAIIFVILEICIFSILNIRTDNLTAITNKNMEYNKMLDSAIDDGIIDLVEVDSKRNLILNKEVAVTQFYTSLYANFGILGDSSKETKLRGYVPVILVTDTDGFYINYTDSYQSLDGVLQVKRWSEKIPYTYTSENLIYKFTLGTYVTIYDSNTNEVREGDYTDLESFYPDSIMSDKETFDTYRRNAIITEIEKYMNDYINEYNKIAYQFGITYQFWLPVIDKADWYRTIDDISMLVIFQGYPYNVGSLDTYNRYALGGARIKKTQMYYITEENGVKYYHKADCNHYDSNNLGFSYYSKEECALEGAFPCPDCNP